jgi:methionine-rich copper-binding protein CopC
MNSIRRPHQAARPRPGRGTRHFDRLEARLALSTAGAPALVIDSGQSGAASVSLVDPAPGSTLGQSPASITITFDRSVAAAMTSGDFRLDLVAPGGSETAIGGLVESLGADSEEVVLTPASPLGPGHYQLDLLGSSSLAGASGVDRPVDDFTIAPPTGGLATAVELGSPVSAVATASGSLDLADDPGALDYYRVELPPGHFWRLGTEVNAGAIGSPLLSSLAVYNANGQPIATQDDWNPAQHNDPYLYVGLNPGVYYIGVSGRTALPHGMAPTGGAFDLQVVADPADAATTVVSSTLDYADPTEDVPTGLTLQFSGAMDESAMAGNPSGLIEIVDASGHAWSAGATSYNGPGATATFVFDQPLPAGGYTVMLAGQGGLVDLIGRAPVAPGLPAGELAHFTVPKAVANPNPDDYGPVFLDTAEQGASAKLQLGPNQDLTYRFVITVQGFYDLTTTYGGDAPSFTAHVGGASVSLAAGTEGVAQNHVVYLKPGVITLDVKGGAHGSTIDWSFLLNSGSYDLLLDNGVGQVSPLGLRLVTPSLTDTPAGSGPVDGPSAFAVFAAPASVATTSSSGPSSAPSAVANAAPTGPATVAANPAGTSIAIVGMVGFPSSQDGAVAVVGPVAPGGMTALSSSAVGIPQGLSVGYSSRPGARRGGDPDTIATAAAAEIDGAALASADPVAPRPVADLPPLPEAPGQEEVAGGPGLVDRVSTVLAGWLPSRRDAGSRAPVAPASLDDAALAGLGRDRRSDLPESGEDVETADLSSPLGVVVVAVVAAHYHKRFSDWLRRPRTPMVAHRQGTIPSGPRRPTA